MKIKFYHSIFRKEKYPNKFMFLHHKGLKFCDQILQAAAVLGEKLF